MSRNARSSICTRASSARNCEFHSWHSSDPGSLAAMSAVTTRVRSTTRPRRLLVPSASTEHAFVRMAGATIAVSTANGLFATNWYCITLHLLRVLLDGAYFITAEMHKNCFVRRVPIDPVFRVVALRVALAHLAIRLAHRRNHLFAVHSRDGVALCDGFLHFRWERINPMYGGGMLAREIQEGREQVLQIVWRKVRNVFWKLKIQSAAHARLESRRAGILPRGGRGGLRIAWAAYADLNVLAPIVLWAPATVNVHNDGVLAEFQPGNLRVVPGVDGRSMRGDHAIEILLVERLVRVKDEAFFSSRNRLAHLRKFSGDKSDQRELRRLRETGVLWRRGFRRIVWLLRIRCENRQNRNALAGSRSIWRLPELRLQKGKLRQIRRGQRQKEKRDGKPMEHTGKGLPREALGIL